MTRDDSLSPPFSHRELNGETLLAELARLRGALVHQRHLDACAEELSRLRAMDVDAAILAVEKLARTRFKDQGMLAIVLREWGSRLRQPADVRALAAHFLRLARVSAIIGALWQTERKRHG